MLVVRLEVERTMLGEEVESAFDMDASVWDSPGCAVWSVAPFSVAVRSGLVGDCGGTVVFSSAEVMVFCGVRTVGENGAERNS